MPDSESIESPLEAAAGTAGDRAIDAFSVLGNETRLSILLALWEAFEPWEPDDTLSFSELRERLGRPDSGQFNYHLEKLRGQFVRKTDAGYELRHAGHQVVRTVIAGAGLEDPSFPPAELDRDCPFCRAPTAISYDDGTLVHACTACEGRFGSRGQFTAGGLAAAEFDPAGVANRSPAELFDACWIRATSTTQSALGGVCDACSGPMEGWLHRCRDHAEEGVCPTCRRRSAVAARFRCPVCKRHHELVPWCSWLLANHPAVIAFYEERGVPLRYEGDARLHPQRLVHLEADHDVELRSEEPLRVHVTIEEAGDALRLTFDESLDVVDVRERTDATGGRFEAA